jgi:hypothetical protein
MSGSGSLAICGSELRSRETSPPALQRAALARFPFQPAIVAGGSCAGPASTESGRSGSAGQHPRQMPYFSRLSTFWSVTATSDRLPLCVTLGRPSDDGAQPFGAIKDIEVACFAGLPDLSGAACEPGLLNCAGGGVGGITVGGLNGCVTAAVPVPPSRAIAIVLMETQLAARAAAAKTPT